MRFSYQRPVLAFRVYQKHSRLSSEACVLSHWTNSGRVAPTVERAGLRKHTPAVYEVPSDALHVTVGFAISSPRVNCAPRPFRCPLKVVPCALRSVRSR